MIQIIIKLVGILIVFVGVSVVYDARIYTKRFFGFGNQNEATSGLKIAGFAIALIGGLILYFCK